MLTAVALVSLWQNAQAVEVIAQDKQVTVVLSRPAYNEDGTPCLDLAGYYLYRSTSENGPYTRINNMLLPAAQTTFVDRQLLNNVNYYYVATSVDDVGNEGSRSAEKMARPTGDEEKPSPITDLTISSENGVVSLAWTFANDNEAVDHYDIYRDITEIKDIYLAHKNTPSQVIPIVSVDAATDTYTDDEVNAGTKYYYVVTAFDASGNEADSSNCVSILVQGLDITPPQLTAVDEDTASVPQRDGNLINLIVIGESDCNVTVKLDGLTGELEMAQTAQPGTYVYTYEVAGGLDKADIPVVAKITDAAGNTSTKTSDTKVSIDNTPPQVAQNIILNQVNETLVRLSWTGGGEDAHHYVLYRYNQPIDSENKGLATVLDARIRLGNEEFLDDTLSAGNDYYYTVGSVDRAGNESFASSELLSIAPDTEPPEIIMVTEDTMGATRKVNDLIEVTIIGEPGLTATFSIEELVEMPMNEEMIGDIHSGTYSAQYMVKAGDSALDAIVSGKLTDSSGLITTKEAAGRINIVTDSSDTTLPEISYVEHDAVSVLVAEDELTVTVEGEAGCAAFADLGSMEKAIPLQEIDEGRYEGTYRVARGDNLNEATVLVHLVDSAGNEATEMATSMVNIDTNIVITMSRENNFLFADGQSTTRVTAQLTNAKGEAVANEPVDFTLAGGDGQVTASYGRTDSSGRIRATYQAGEIVMTAFICAEAVGTGDVGLTYVLTKKSISIDILLTSQSANLRTDNTEGYAIEVFAKPHRITADGHSVSVITALVTLNDAPVEDVRVSFDIVQGIQGNEGSLEVIRAYTDVHGEAEAVYTAATKTQLIKVQATAYVPSGDAVSENTHILLIAGGVKYLFIEATEMELIADGSSTTEITVRAEDEYNNRAPMIRVEFSLTNNLGSLDVPYDFTSNSSTDKIEYHDSGTAQPAVGGGEAFVTFTAGTRAGTETIVAEVTSQTWGGAGDYFQNGLDNFSQGGSYEVSIEKFNLALDFGKESNLGFKTDYTEENWTDDVLYMRGYSYEMIKNYSDAILSFEEVVGYYFGGTWADNSHYRIGQCYEKDGNNAQAIISYQQVIDNYRSVDFDTRNLRDNAQFRIARCYEKSGYVVLARNAYQRLMDLHSDSDLVENAEAAIKRLNQY